MTTVVGLPIGGSEGGSPGSGTTITTTSSNQRNGGSGSGGFESTKPRRTDSDCWFSQKR